MKCDKLHTIDLILGQKLCLVLTKAEAPETRQSIIRNVVDEGIETIMKCQKHVANSDQKSYAWKWRNQAPVYKKQISTNDCKVVCHSTKTAGGWIREWCCGAWYKSAFHRRTNNTKSIFVRKIIILILRQRLQSNKQTTCESDIKINQVFECLAWFLI